MADTKTEIELLNSLTSFYEGGDPMDQLIIEREVELIKKTIRTRNNALEIGCGNGYSTKYMLNIFENFELMEPSINNINLMRTKIKDNFVIHMSLLEDFISIKKYDNILFLNVLEHVENPVVCLTKLKDLVSDEGLIYVSVPNCMSLNRRAGYKMGLLEKYNQKAPKDIRVGHRTLYTVSMLRRHGKEAGLKCINMKGIYLKPLSEKQMLDLGGDVIKTFYSLGEDIPEYCAVLFAVFTKEDY
jgi:2-polyprenyl-3-methyl-5-hydroxy-6-metoxy-1,4-benzoquinol methylase